MKKHKQKKNIKIGELELHGKTVLAPLAGITNLPFRLIAKEYSCALVCSEMISAKGLLYNSKKTFTLLDSTKMERPLSVQIFGSDPMDMAKAAAIIEEKGCADIIDINFGCSVKKVLKTGSGAALMKEPENAKKLIQAVRKNISIPLTIKIRSGWDQSGDQALNIAKIAEDCGVNAIAFHPRTARQGFRGCADWSLIKRLKEQSSIPVIGNGDILTPEDGVRMMEETGCDAVMVGRAAMGNPFIFSGIEALLNGRDYNQPGRDEIFGTMKKLLSSYVDYFGEKTGVRMMRSRLTWFVKGLPKASNFRRTLAGIDSYSQALTLINEFQHR